MRFQFLFLISYFLFSKTCQSQANTTIDSFTDTSKRSNLSDQSILESKIINFIKPYKAKIGISIIKLESTDTISINNDFQYPMQSVYKFPLAMAVLNEVDKGKLSLNQKIHIAPSDLRKKTWSPLMDKYPKGNIDVTIAELLEYTVSKSDNNTCDILFGLIGIKQANDFIHLLNVKDIQIVATEYEMTKAWPIQYTNYCSPLAMSSLLSSFYKGKCLSDSSTKFLINLMIESSNSPMRIKGNLPEGIVVAHKTGTSGTDKHGIRAAVNDVGIIALPNGKHIALTIFVSNSKEEFETNEKIIADISKIIFDYYFQQ